MHSLRKHSQLKSSIDPSKSPHDAGAIGLSILVFVLLSLAASITSQGFLEADGCTHYLYALFAFAEPHYLVNIWGRPLCTALYAGPAMLAGRFGVRCASLILAVALSIVSYNIAKRQGLCRPALALIFTLAQPLVFLHSFSELTELPFALILALSFLAYQNRRWILFAILVSILPLARPEGFGFIALVAIALLALRRWKALILLPIPLLLWSYVGWRTYGSPSAYPWYTWLRHNWPYAERSAYLSGSIFHFVMLLPAIVSPLLLPAFFVGVMRTLAPAQGAAFRSRIQDFFFVHRARCGYLIALIPLSIMAGHSFLYATGRMASSGEMRYMLIVAPFWAILAAIGWERLFELRGWRFQTSAAMIAAIAPLFCNSFYQVLPLSYSDDWLRAQQAAAWIETSPLSKRYPRIQTAHPGIFYFLGISQTDRDRAVEFKSDRIDAPRPGVILIWDWVYGLHNADRARVIPIDEILRAGWIPIPAPAITDATRGKSSTWCAFLSPIDVDGRPTIARVR